MKNPSYISVIVSAAIQWVCGAVWYISLGKPWMEGIGKTEEQLKNNPWGPSLPFALAFFSNLLMARVISGVVLNTGDPTVKRGAGIGAAMWLGCAFAVLLNGYAFEGRGPVILAINGGYMLVCFVIAGVIAGAWKHKAA